MQEFDFLGVRITVADQSEGDDYKIIIASPDAGCNAGSKGDLISDKVLKKIISQAGFAIDTSDPRLEITTSEHAAYGTEDNINEINTYTGVCISTENNDGIQRIMQIVEGLAKNDNFLKKLKKDYETHIEKEYGVGRKNSLSTGEPSEMSAVDRIRSMYLNCGCDPKYLNTPEMALFLTQVSSLINNRRDLPKRQRRGGQ